MTPADYEGALICYIGAVVIFVLVAIGWIRLEWHLSARDREQRRHGRIEW